MNEAFVEQYVEINICKIGLTMIPVIKRRCEITVNHDDVVVPLYWILARLYCTVYMINDTCVLVV